MHTVAVFLNEAILELPWCSPSIPLPLAIHISVIPAITVVSDTERCIIVKLAIFGLKRLVKIRPQPTFRIACEPTVAHRYVTIVGSSAPQAVIRDFDSVEQNLSVIRGNAVTVAGKLPLASHRGRSK